MKPLANSSDEVAYLYVNMTHSKLEIGHDSSLNREVKTFQGKLYTFLVQISAIIWIHILRWNVMFSGK